MRSRRRTARANEPWNSRPSRGKCRWAYATEDVSQGGIDYTRFRFKALVRPTQAGTFELEAPQVVTKLQTGTGRDAFGFRARRYGLFRAAGDPTRVVVSQLPASGRPSSFAGAVGSGFSIDAQASRTVVSVGEPIELTITVRSRSNLEGLRLPALDRAGLDGSVFEVAGENPPGEMTEDGNGRVFVVPVRLTSAEAREIPALELAYFDASTGEYRIARSEPIALSVAGSAVVGAAQVVSSANQSASQDAASDKVGALGVELTLSESSRTLRTVRSVSSLTPALVVLYTLPLLILIARLWQVRTRATRGRMSQVTGALRDLSAQLETASSAPARDVAPRLVAELRNVAKACGREPRHAIIGELETAAFDPKASSSPLSADLCARVKSLAQTWVDAKTADERNARGKGLASSSAAALALFVGVSLAVPGIANADAPAAEVSGDGYQARLEKARGLYQTALGVSDRTERAREFTRAEAAFRQLVDEDGGDRPELLADWGHAALGAGDVGRAALAYRRALQLDRSLARARRNLEWLRAQAPAWTARPTAEGAVDTLFFWHTGWSPAARHIVSAAAFCAMILLLVPWPVRRRRLLCGLAVIPALIFLAMATSLMLERDEQDHAIVVADGHVLRSADSDGAPAVVATPVPAGSEVLVLETRGTWARVEIGKSTKGWLPSPAVVAVRARDASD